MEKLYTPVLFIIFNRPETTFRVFKEIQRAKPKKLYIFADGPRTECKSDFIKCQETRDITKQVNWDCNLKTKFMEQNLGCGPGPVTAISWIFEKENRAIILEDDCLPAQCFFVYCQQLLELYKNDTRIWVISGNNYNEERQVKGYSYFFSRYGHSWGWATWKRCWKHFDHQMKKWPIFKKDDKIYDAFPSKKEANFFSKNVDRIYKDKSSFSHIWDFQFAFTVFSNGGLSIVPKYNLVKNIGYVGTHSNKKAPYHDRKVHNDYKIEKHPEFILPTRYYDDYHFKKHWLKIGKASLLKKIVRKFIKISKRRK